MTKGFLTNCLAALVAIAGYFAPHYGEVIMMTGLFALSGGVTNWLAVHMLFEKVPLMYGSGVVPRRFAEFKSTLRDLIMSEFFTREQVERFLAEGPLSPAKLGEQVDRDRVFDGMVEVIEASSLGSMLSMVGGRKALEPLREPMSVKLAELIASVVEGTSETGVESTLADRLVAQIEHLIDQRLDELTPEHVKAIVEDIIKEHLGWLVVWGGVVGGLIGLVVALANAV
ncbi:MAG: DUF445 family protein [Pseudomonadota bacterium]